MHETGAVTAAIEGALDTLGPVDHLGFVIRDPTRAEEDSVRFLAAALLRDRGLGTTTFDVRVRSVRCSECRRVTRPTPRDPVCGRCGAPIPPRLGPAIVALAAGGGRRARRCA